MKFVQNNCENIFGQFEKFSNSVQPEVESARMCLGRNLCGAEKA